MAQERDFFWSMEQIKKEVVPYVTNFKKIRLGDSGEGGYVICDGIPSSGLYSYGSNDTIKFENAYHEKFGKECWVYDHTIPGITNKPDYIHFFKEGVSHETTREMDTIDNQVAKNGHTDCKDMYAQIDIEGCEWTVLTASEKIKEFAQVLIEFHAMNDLNCMLETLKFMNKYFVCVHVHANNWPMRPWLDNDFPCVFECTYVRRDLVTTMEVDYQTYPNPDLDSPNNPGRPDMPLTWWKVL
jgi:hypothetical protein